METCLSTAPILFTRFAASIFNPNLGLEKQKFGIHKIYPRSHASYRDRPCISGYKTRPISRGGRQTSLRADVHRDATSISDGNGLFERNRNISRTRWIRSLYRSYLRMNTSHWKLTNGSIILERMDHTAGDEKEKFRDINFLGKGYIIFYSKKNLERKSSRIFKVHRNYELFIFLRIQNNSRMRQRMRKWFVTISDIIFRDFTTWKLEKLIRNKYIYLFFALFASVHLTFH